MAFDLVQTFLSVGGLVALLLFGYYATRLLSSFRTGLLEKGWKEVAIGSVFLVAAQFAYIPSGLAGTELFNIIIDIGIALDMLGTIFLALGIRAHYLVWRIDTKKSTANKKVEESQAGTKSTTSVAPEATTSTSA